MDYPVIDVKATGSRIRELRKANHLRVEDIVTFMGFESVQAVYKWQRGDSLPSLDNMYALSRLFSTPIDNIICCTGDEKEGESSPLPFHGFFQDF